MATEATFTVPSDQFPLGTVFERLPGVTVELERINPPQDVVIPYFWVRGTEVEDIASFQRRCRELEIPITLTKLQALTPTESQTEGS